MPTLVVGFSQGGRIWIFFGIAPEYRKAVMGTRGTVARPSLYNTSMSFYGFVMLADA